MISLHFSHISSRHGAYFFYFFKFVFVCKFKYSSFALVLFASELIPAVGAPAAIFVAVWRNPPQERRCVGESATAMTRG
jgi:hypothetical protein